MRLQAAALVESKVMDRAAPVMSANNLPGLTVDNHLALQGVALLFATVISFLLFFGRSIGVSATSTTTKFGRATCSTSLFGEMIANEFDHTVECIGFYTAVALEFCGT